ncbi:receptor-like protein 36 [Salvia hispanica]|uniref:receptor-like protein 36 n=1 Tax=Salvia hispanica TaxID=49212 RepID=UPI0020098997|nr:receptor-like protein 36 [Salvia hispanica]
MVEIVFDTGNPIRRVRSVNVGLASVHRDDYPHPGGRTSARDAVVGPNKRIGGGRANPADGSLRLCGVFLYCWCCRRRLWGALLCVAAGVSISGDADGIVTPGVECDASGYVVSLHLDDEAISGGIEDSSSLFRFEYLQKLNLAFNDFNYTHPIPKEVPAEIASLKILVSLDISNYDCSTPEECLSLEYPNLEMLVGNLTGLRELYWIVSILPHFMKRNKLSHIVSSHLPNFTSLSLAHCNLYGPLSKSFWELHSLSILRLNVNDVSIVELPDLFAKFPSLTILGLRNCSLKGSIPSTFATPTELIHVDLSKNFLTGSLPSTLFEGLSNLAHLNLTWNSFSGNIPRSLYALPSLLELHLIYNQFSGTFKLDNLLSLTNLTYLGLAQKSLSVDVGKVDSSSYGRFQLKVLALGSCNLSNIPNFIKHSHIEILELSDNRIAGEIPSLIWGTQLTYLNLSFNLLTDFQKPYHIPASLKYLYLDSNQLRGELQLPIPLASQLWWLSFANNSLSGSIPTFLCNATHLDFLILSENKLSGSIPPCLLENVRGIEVDQNKVSGNIPDHFTSHCRLEFLYLYNNSMEGKIPKSLEYCRRLKAMDIGNNNISGNIPDIFSMDCKLIYLSLSNNNLEGKIPKSLKSCMSLEVMDVGNNNINDTFPCMLSSSLRVLILHSNRFHGKVTCNMTWSALRNLDIASNNFIGRLESINFSSWRGMMQWSYAQSYEVEVTLIMKGLKLELKKIWHDFGSIDFSCNNFIGEIPNAIGNLTALYHLNLSHNALNGSIPQSFGHLGDLESLDLSRNQLTGPISTGLEELTFLEVLNLSYISWSE